jgi:hypothetical protein
MVDPSTGIDFPIFQSQLSDIFGEPNEGQFARDYLRTLDLSEYAEAFSHVRDFEGNKWGCKIYTNFAMHGPLKRAFDAIVAQGLAGQLKSYDGSWNIRRMKGGNSWSVHSWGMAIDFNAATNPFGPELITDFSDEFIKCFTQAGMEWGGSWSGNKDAMHYQLPWNRDWRNENNRYAPIPWEA